MFNCPHIEPRVPTIGFFLDQAESSDLLDYGAHILSYAKFDAELKSVLYNVTNGHPEAIMSLRFVISNDLNVSI